MLSKSSSVAYSETQMIFQNLIDGVLTIILRYFSQQNLCDFALEPCTLHYLCETVLMEVTTNVFVEKSRNYPKFWSIDLVLKMFHFIFLQIERERAEHLRPMLQIKENIPPSPSEPEDEDEKPDSVKEESEDEEKYQIPPNMKPTLQVRKNTRYFLI